MTVNAAITTTGANNVSLSGVGVTVAGGVAVNAGSGTILVDGGGGVIGLSTSTLSTTNATAGAVTIQNGAATTLGNITASSGTVVLGTGALPLSGAIGQTALTTLNVANLTAVGGSTITLGNGTNQIVATGVIQRGGLVSITSSVAMTVNGTISTGTITNTVTLSSGGLLTVNAGVSATNFAISLTGVGVTVAGGVTVNSGSGTLTVTSGTGTLTTGALTLLLTTGTAALINDLVALNAGSQIGGTGAGAGNATTVTVVESTAGRTIGIAGGAGLLSLSAAGLATIRSTTVRIGDANSGAMAINAWAPVAAFGTSVVSLYGAGVTQGGAVNLGVARSLMVRGAGSAVLTLGNTVATVAATLTGVGSLFSLTDAATVAMTVGSVTDDLGTLNGVTAPGGVTLTASGAGGLLTVNQGVSATNNPISLSGVGVTVAGGVTVNSGSGTLTVTSGTGTLTTGAGTLLLTTGTAALINDLVALDAGSQIGGTGAGAGNATTVTVVESTAGRTIGIAGGAGLLSLSAAGLATIRSTTVRIGDANSGAMAINAWAPVAAFGTSVVSLYGAGVTQGGAVNLGVARSLMVRGAGSAVLTLGNTVATVAATLTGAGSSFSLTDAATVAMTVGSVTDDLGTLNGVTAPGGVTLTASGAGGLLTVNAGVSATNNAISLSGVGVTVAGGVAVNAGSGTILVDGGGGVIGLNTSTLSTTNATAGAVTIQNGAATTLGNITASSGTVVLGTGALPLSGAIGQTALTTLNVANLTAVGGSTITLGNGTNQIVATGVIQRGGDVSIASSVAMTVNGTISTGTLASGVTLSSRGRVLLTVNAAITTTGANNVSLSGTGVTQAAVSTIERRCRDDPR